MSVTQKSNGHYLITVPYYSPVKDTFFFSYAKNGSRKNVPALSDLRSERGREVRFIKLQYPYLDTTILAKYIAMNVHKYNFTRVQKLLYKNMSFFESKRINEVITFSNRKQPSDLHLSILVTGLKMEISGRLTTQRSIPRKTVSSSHTGSLTNNPRSASMISKGSIVANANKESSFLSKIETKYASKNNLGAYTVKV